MVTPAPVRYTLKAVRPDDRVTVAKIARLHKELLDFGPMARLGERFLRDFCYTVLVSDGLMHAVLCEVGQEPAGFVVYTSRAHTFHRTAIRRHALRVAWLGLLSALSDSRPFARLLEAAQTMLARRGEPPVETDPSAEVLAIAVKPQFSNPAFVRTTGLRLSELLVRHCATAFRQEGLGRMRMIVDADNRPALFFYSALGARLEPYPGAVRPSMVVVFDLDTLDAMPAGAPMQRQEAG